jgi:hypothetical protein
MRDDKVPVDYVLYKINKIFKVIDISNDLITAKDLAEAKEIHAKKDFDRIPIKKGRRILSYYDSKSGKILKIKPEETISGSMGILEIFSYLSKKDFYFVRIKNSRKHIVHYSDLNNPLLSVAIYAQVAYCEIAIRKLLREQNTNEADFGEQFIRDLNGDVEGALKQFKIKKRDHLETDLFDELYFEDELKMFREIIKFKLDQSKFQSFEKFIDLSDNIVKNFKNLRNDVMHSKPEIIRKNSDIEKWQKFLDTCQNIIKVISGKAG